MPSGVGRSVQYGPPDLTKLSKSKSYEFVLNHKRDDKIAIVIGLYRDLTIEVYNKSWNNLFVDLKETIEANVSKETLDIVGFVVGLINNTTFVNIAVFNRFVELDNSKGDARNFGYFWDVGFSERYIGGDCPLRNWMDFEFEDRILKVLGCGFRHSAGRRRGKREK
ncbi:hypothetical protein Tco_0162749 [Tanacetum coccineum]